jgi:hypothetical protein
MEGTTCSVNINPVSEKAVVCFECIYISTNDASVSPRASEYFVRGYFDGNSILKFERGPSTAGINNKVSIRWTVIDFIGAKRVQKGITLFNNGQTIVVPIEECNPAKSLIYFSFSSDDWMYIYGRDIQAYFSSNTSLTFYKYTPAYTGDTIQWYVVEFY